MQKITQKHVELLIPSTEIKDLRREKGKNGDSPTPLSMSNLGTEKSLH